MDDPSRGSGRSSPRSKTLQSNKLTGQGPERHMATPFSCTRRRQLPSVRNCVVGDGTCRVCRPSKTRHWPSRDREEQYSGSRTSWHNVLQAEVPQCLAASNVDNHQILPTAVLEEKAVKTCGCMESVTRSIPGGSYRTTTGAG